MGSEEVSPGLCDTVCFGCSSRTC